jgi:cytidylate kinase
MSIAIDGPGGAGKSTVAKAIAKLFGFIYVDTGAIYRTVGLAVKRAGADPKSSVQVEPLLKELNIELKYDGSGSQKMLLNNEDVTGLIRTPEMSLYASAVSALPEVRSFLLNMQRDMALKTDVVMDGRDIGTVVLPNAQVKIFLTATPEERARRRYEELREKGTPQFYEDVLNDMILRDNNDSSRAIAPLRPAEDAITINTTGLDINEVVTLIAGFINDRQEDRLKASFSIGE